MSSELISFLFPKVLISKVIPVQFERRDEDLRKRAHIKNYYYKDYHKRISDDNIGINPRSTPNENPKICIIGAGTAGLLTALLLKEAGIEDVTILEYQDRVGGRVHTHYFTDDPNDDRRLYGELGAMRIPYVDGPNNKMMTKNFTKTAKVTQLGYPDKIPDDYVNYFDEALSPFFDELDKNFTSGLEALEEYDYYTTYTYLREVYLPKKLPTKSDDYDEIIKAIEINKMGIGEFKYGLVDIAMEEYTFNPNFNLSWTTIDKGMQRLPNAFLPLIKKANYTLKYNSEVYKLEKTEDGQKVKVHWKSKGKKDSDVFDRVVVTAPIGCTRHWDLPSTLSYDKRRALREFDYLNAGKIFLQFKSRFWEKSPLETGALQTTSNVGIVGGTTSTDLPVRTVVYPSYYQGLPEDGPGVLLASYTWDNDASKYAPFTEEECFELALKDIVTLHGEIARKEWIPGKENNKAHYWPNDKTVVGGAYAKFGVGQVKYLMGAMMRSEDFIHWAGEHTDIHNAWILGALNSGVRVVKEILQDNLMNDKWIELKNSRLLKYWNGNLDAYKGY
ncbi:10164_t:CDS:2 [Dentiscutata erythropus]|uniref:10164_t:CDS:1 n=1 Tax=Dentiscutata erythropus TaxID=1348616 RepID=A0A9N8ZE70_9GLOM|nr:10164_t:CDS:2 [Dentiscutata erythropus]